MCYGISGKPNIPTDFFTPNFFMPWNFFCHPGVKKDLGVYDFLLNGNKITNKSFYVTHLVCRRGCPNMNNEYKW